MSFQTSQSSWGVMCVVFFLTLVTNVFNKSSFLTRHPRILYKHPSGQTCKNKVRIFKVALPIKKFYKKMNHKSQQNIKFYSSSVYLITSAMPHIQRQKGLQRLGLSYFVSFSRVSLDKKRASRSRLAAVEVQATRSISKETRASLRVSDCRVV